MLSWVIVDRAQCRSINRDDRDLEELSRRARNDVAKLSDAQPAYERAEPKWEAIERYARMMQVTRPEIPSEAAESMCAYAHCPSKRLDHRSGDWVRLQKTSSDLRRRQTGTSDAASEAGSIPAWGPVPPRIEAMRPFTSGTVRSSPFTDPGSRVTGGSRRPFSGGTHAVPRDDARLRSSAHKIALVILQAHRPRPACLRRKRSVDDLEPHPLSL